MTITSADFLSCAEKIAQGGAEVDYRSSVSRAYYSAYHAAVPIAALYYPDPNAGNGIGAHERLSERFKASANLKAKGLAYMLISLKRARHHADYDIQDSVLEEDAAQAMADARAIHARLNQCVPTQSVKASGSAQADGSP